MVDGSSIVKKRQLAIRRELDRRGIALKIVSMDSGVPYSTLASYFPADGLADPAQMPVGVLYALCGHVPDDLLSLLLPEGRLIVQVPANIDHDEIAPAMRDYLKAKDDAHHPESEAGREIGPSEDNVLRGKFARVGVTALWPIMRPTFSRPSFAGGIARSGCGFAGPSPWTDGFWRLRSGVEASSYSPGRTRSPQRPLTTGCTSCGKRSGRAAGRGVGLACE